MSAIDPDQKTPDMADADEDARPLTGEPVAPMRLRPEPPRVTRLSRKALVRIMGSKSDLLRTLIAAQGGKSAAIGVPGRVLKWRRGRDTTPRPK